MGGDIRKTKDRSTKDRKTKDRKTKDRKTKNRKTKNRHTKDRKTKDRKTQDRKTKERKTKDPTLSTQCAGRHLRTKLISQYIGSGQKKRFDVRIQELVSKVQNPGEF